MKTINLTLFVLVLSGSFVLSSDQCCADCISGLGTDPLVREGETALPNVTTMEPSDQFTVGTSKSEIKDSPCGKYWKDNGNATCCNQGELKARIAAMRERFINRVKSLVGKIKDHKEKDLDRLKEVMGNSNAQEKMNENRGGRGSAEKDAGRMSSEMKFMEKLNSAGSSARAAGRSKALGQAKKCLAHYFNTRVRGLCIRCGVKVHEFVTAGGDYKVKQSLCEGFVEKCGRFVGEALKRVAIDRMNREMVKDLGGEPGAPTSSVYSLTEEAEFELAIEAADGDAQVKDDADKRKKFCKFFTLNVDNPMFMGDGKIGKAKASQIPSSATNEIVRVVNRMMEMQVDGAGGISEEASGFLSIENIDIGDDSLQEGDLVSMKLAVFATVLSFTLTMFL